MERRIYFLAGDVLSNGIMGMAAAWLAATIVNPDWHMVISMLVGMGVGMGLSLILMPVFVGLFGAMEVMLPVMLTAMLAGMAFGMVVAMQELSAFEVLLGGALIGIFVLLFSYIANIRIQGKSM